MLGSLVAVAALGPALFSPAPGWHVGAARVHACPGASAADCRSAFSWAATVRWRDCAGCLPHRTVEALPPDGIALQLQVSVERHPPRWLRPMRWPPRIRGVAAPFEGLPPRIGVFQASGFVRGYGTSLFIFFGRPVPTPAQTRRARGMLARVRFPATRSRLARSPYVGVACRLPCQRLGVAVWLRRPADGVSVRIRKQTVRLHAGGLGGRGPRYWEGYLRLPSLRLPRGWAGVRPVVPLTLRLTIRAGRTRAVERVRVHLRPGWG